MRVIKASEVKAGDTIHLMDRDTRSFTVLSIEAKDQFLYVLFESFNGRQVFACPMESHELVILVHRSWPEGMTDVKMLNYICEILGIGLIKMTKNDLIKLRDAIDDYQMSLPEPGISNKPTPPPDLFAGIL